MDCIRQRGIDTTKEERDQGLEELDVFREWVERYVLVPGESVEDGPIMMIPLGRPGANYRDIVTLLGYVTRFAQQTYPILEANLNRGDFATTAYNSGFFASILGLPQPVVPNMPISSRLPEQY